MDRSPHLDQPPPRPKGLRVRLVGGVMDGRTHVITNPDDIVQIIVPVRDEGGYGQQVYRRVMDKEGLRYVND